MNYKTRDNMLFSVDTQNDQKLKLYLSLASVFLGIVLLLLGCAIVPISELYNVAGPGPFILRTLILILIMIACLVLRELIHAAAVRIFTGYKADICFERLCPYVWCRNELEKWEFVCISLAPFVILTALLVTCLIVLPVSWFWVVYITLVMHAVGSVADVYCAFKVISIKQDIYVKYNGISVEVWSA